MIPAAALSSGVRLLMSPALLAASFAAESRSVVSIAPETHVYKEVAGCMLKADVYRPSGTGLHPVVVWIHGGALMLGSRKDLHRQQRERYLAVGLAIAAIDYRLAPETKLPEIVADVRDAISWLRGAGRESLGIDPDRLALVGHSAGGYLALVLGTVMKPTPQAIVSFYGYGDITGDWYTRPDPVYSRMPAISRNEAYQAVSDVPIAEEPPRGRIRLYRYFRQQGLWPREVTGHDPGTEPRWFDAWCPVRNVTPGYPPTLLLHGDRDSDVPVEESMKMATEFRRHAVPHDFIRHPEWGHAFDVQPPMLRDPDTGQAFEAVLRFLSRRLAPRHQ